MAREKKNKRIYVRLNEKDYSHAWARAEMYSEGDLSAWVRNCLKNYIPKIVKGRGINNGESNEKGPLGKMEKTKRPRRP